MPFELHVNVGLAICLAIFSALAFALPKVFPLNLRHRKDLPPGPEPELFWGNSRQGPKKQPWRWYRELQKQYGDVVYLRMGPTPMVLLMSAEAAWDLLEKRSAIYSGRPDFILGGQILSGGLRGLMISYSDVWRRWRKCLHGAFMPSAANKYKPIQMLESSVLLHQFLKEPNEFRVHIERYAASVVVLITYAKRVLDFEHDRVVEGNRTAMGALNEINIPGKFLVETFPILKYLPESLAPWKKFAMDQRRADERFYFDMIDQVKAKMKAGKPIKCFARDMIENQEKLGMSDIEVAYAAATPFDAGVETSSGTLASFVLACVKYGKTFIPKAQEELDRIVGNERLPTFDDYDELPYVRAVVAETMRWRPIAVLGGTPHKIIEEDTYRGYHIPKGATIMAPLFCIHSNEADFPDPENFIPERFLDQERMAKYPGNLGHSNFGWGRRICPGIHLGQTNAFLVITRILWGFNITNQLDADGKPIDVDIDAFTDGFDSEPLPFPAKITVRSPQHATVIEREHEEALVGLAEYDSDL